MSVVFLLATVIFSNTLISDYNFHKGSILLGYIDEKGANYDSAGNMIVKSTTTENKTYSITPHALNLIKVATADTAMWGKSLNRYNAQEDTTPRNITISTNANAKMDFTPMMVQTSAVVAPASFFDHLDEQQKYGIIKYTVENGDTPSSIATSFGISTYTLLWANNMKVGQYIKPGQVLEILPITGVKHTVVAKDTIQNIAKKYKADEEEIIKFNELPADGQLTVDKTLIIPNGEKEKPIIEPAPRPNQNGGTVISSGKYAFSGTQKGHRFPYGQCTWYVSTKTYVPWGGHAKSWLVNSQAYGYTTGKTPVPGAIVVTTEHRIYGHVAYVEEVSPTTITLSEMNYVGWARKSVRVVPRNSAVILGYIYPKE